MSNDFYNYIIFDLSKPGKYQYRSGEIYNYEPYYVGKGHNSRLVEHLGQIKETVKKVSTFVYNKMRKIYRETGLKPLIIKVVDHLCEEQAFENEIFLISQIGRRDLERGPLCNLTGGGDGPAGENAYWYGKKKPRESVEKQRQKISGINNPNYGKPRSEETKRKSSLAQKGKTRGPLSEETKKKLSERFKGRTYTPEQIEKYRLSKMGDKNPMKNRIMPEEEKKRRSNSAKLARAKQKLEKQLEVSQCSQMLPLN